MSKGFYTLHNFGLSKMKEQHAIIYEQFDDGHHTGLATKDYLI